MKRLELKREKEKSNKNNTKNIYSAFIRLLQFACLHNRSSGDNTVWHFSQMGPSGVGGCGGAVGGNGRALGGWPGGIGRPGGSPPGGAGPPGACPGGGALPAGPPGGGARPVLCCL